MKIADTDAIGAFGEVLKFYVVPLDKMETYSTPENTASNTVKVSFTKEVNYGENFINPININGLSEDKGYLQFNQRVNMLYRGGEQLPTLDKGKEFYEYNYISNGETAKVKYYPNKHYYTFYRNSKKAALNVAGSADNIMHPFLSLYDSNDKNAKDIFNTDSSYGEGNTSIFAMPLILPAGEYFISKHTMPLSKSSTTVSTITNDATGKSSSATNLDISVNFTEPKLVVGVRINLNNNDENMEETAFIPMIIKKEGIFSDLSSYEIIEEKTDYPMVKFKDSKGNTIITLSTAQVDLLFYKDLKADTIEEIIQLSNRSHITDITYAPNPLIYNIGSGGNFTLKKENPIAVKYQKELQNLPVIVSEDQPDPDQAILWIQPGEMN